MSGDHPQSAMDHLRRRTPRVPSAAQVLWRRRGRSLPARIGNLNANGLFVVTDEIIQLNQVMDLIIELPQGSTSFFAASRFVGPSPAGAGIGCSIAIAAPEDQARWVAHYRECAARVTGVVPPYPRPRR